MTKHLGVWTAEDCALVPVDYQNEMFEIIREICLTFATVQAAPLAAPARDVIYWYFNEVPKLTDEVGVAEAEKLAASAQRGH